MSLCLNCETAKFGMREIGIFRLSCRPPQGWRSMNVEVLPADARIRALENAIAKTVTRIDCRGVSGIDGQSRIFYTKPR